MIAAGISPCNIPASDMVLLTYLPQTVVTLGELPDLCLDDPPLLLTGGYPPGGIYSGTGVVNGTFYPALSGIGTFIITYACTDENECTFYAGQPIHVDECTSAGDQTSHPFIRVIPNPNNGIFDILLNAPSEASYTLMVQEPNGTTVHYETADLQAGTHKVRINLMHPRSGLYFLSVTSDEVSAIRKVIIF